MKKISLKYPVIVEGKYDKIKLSNILSSPVISIGGFSFLNDKKKKSYLSELSKSTKLIILTDSDKAGSFIRSRLKGIVPLKSLINVYIPQIHGKEKRKSERSAENLLGVEGMETEVLLKLLSPYKENKTAEKNDPVTTALFWEMGFSGKSDSAERRKALAKEYSLPDNLSSKALLDALNLCGGKERFLNVVANMNAQTNENTALHCVDTQVDESQIHPCVDTQTDESKTLSCSDANNEKTVSFYTLGCRVNQYETRGVAEQLYQSGFKIVPFGEKCDFAFINTCAVTAESEKKSLAAIKRGAKTSKHVIVAGCYSQHKEDKVKSINGVSFAVGCKGKEQCVGAIKELSHMDFDFSPLSICHVTPKAFPFVSSCRAYIKIQDGCNGNCTYCLIHKLRGKSVVRDADDILQEAKRLADAGYREIILTGIESSAFGAKNLATLISEIDKIDGIKRIRLGSLDPNVLTDEFISCVKDTKSFMPHLHLSVQSPNSRVLRLMKRPYNGEKLRKRIEALREAIPHIMLSADIITSFPTETEEEFEETLDFVKKYSLLHVHAFSFSPRPNTEAYDMDGKIPAKEAKWRNKKLIEVAEDTKKSILTNKLGKHVTVLIESFDGKYFKGHTEDFAEALIENGSFGEGDIETVIPIDVKDGCLICRKE